MAENRFYECEGCGTNEDPMEVQEDIEGLYSATCAKCGHVQPMDEKQAIRVLNEKRAEDEWGH